MNAIAGWSYTTAWVIALSCAFYSFFCWRRTQQSLFLWLALVLVGSAVWATTGVYLARTEDSAVGAFPLLNLWDLCHLALWQLLLVRILKDAAAVFTRYFLWSGTVLLALALLAILGRYVIGAPAQLWFQLLEMSGILFAVLGLVSLEQLYRLGDALSRWRLKPLCLAVGTVFVFELYRFSEELLFGAINVDLWASRGFVYAIAMPLLVLSSVRNPAWRISLAVSRGLIFHSTAIILSGLYLLAVAMAGYYLRYFGGQWGRILQFVVFFSALLGLLIVLLSESRRAQLKVFLDKHLFPYRYDYREQWLKFTHALTNHTETSDLGESVIRALADQVQSPGGFLWLQEDDGLYRLHASTENTAVAVEVDAESPFCRFLDLREWVMDLAEWRIRRRTYDDLPIPTWLSAIADAWLVIPLKTAEGLIGFVVLRTSRTRFDLDWEVLDLLKTSQRQAAGYLAQLRMSEALLDARKFESFHRMSAFVLHDLKGLVAQLALLLQNAERHRDNPAFQADMLETVANVEGKMRHLMAQLQTTTPLSPARRIQLDMLVQQVVAEKSIYRSAIRYSVTGRTPIWIKGDAPQLSRVIGHLIQNALDAIAVDGYIDIALAAAVDAVILRITDNGIGMSEVFMRQHLFRPFQSTKQSGMGLGVYEAQQYLHKIDARLRYLSDVGAGTEVVITFPVIDNN